MVDIFHSDEPIIGDGFTIYNPGSFADLLNRPLADTVAFDDLSILHAERVAIFAGGVAGALGIDIEVLREMSPGVVELMLTEQNVQIK